MEIFRYARDEEGPGRRRLSTLRQGVGGSSSIGRMNWTRGNRKDYDSWASYGVQGWSYDEVLPFFKMSETFEGGDNRFRGGQGPIQVERSKADNPLFQAFLAAGVEAGHGVNHDHNAAYLSGVHRIQHNIGNGRRMSASFAYLHNRPVRPNLDVLLNARVVRVIFQGHRCVAVEVVKNRTRITIPVHQEAICCAGALVSPQLLMLSGVGHADHLRQLDIPVVSHLPAVGQGLSDHICFCVEYEVKDSRESAAQTLPFGGGLTPGLEWLLSRRGPGTSGLFEVGAVLSSDQTVSRPDVQIECLAARSSFGAGEISIAPGFQCFVSLQRPTSTGLVWLSSADPFAPPAFRFNYLRTEHDRKLAVVALRQLRDLMNQPSMVTKLKGEVGEQVACRTDKTLLSWAKRVAKSSYHPSCTLRMGRGEGSVVDSSGKVHGFDNLRVVDASIFPTIPTANLNAPTIMLAEKISADLIRVLA
ncbi:GMC family oxidoreductase N-terminal domain-containing protein [Mesorhizobium sp. M0960]|uniref:GMC family oxidoreductase n=1 Tax=Mesorhizobium sp. M0960 TaxID=2957035 RepID=UPI00333C9D37